MWSITQLIHLFKVFFSLLFFKNAGYEDKNKNFEKINKRLLFWRGGGEREGNVNDNDNKGLERWKLVGKD